jgi:hypothetical protein
VNAQRANPRFVVRLSPWLMLRGAAMGGLVAAAGYGLLAAGWERLGWSLIVGGGALGSVFLLLAAIQPASVVLDDEGLSVRYLGVWRKLGKIRWGDIRKVGIYSAQGGRMTAVLLTLHDPEPCLARLNQLERRQVAGRSQACHVCISLGFQTHTADELAAEIGRRMGRQ